MDHGLLPRRDSDTLDTYYLRTRKVLRGAFDDEFEDIREMPSDLESSGGSGLGNDLQSFSQAPSSEDTSVFLEEVPEEAPMKRRKLPRGVIRLLGCLVLGLICGFFVDKSRISRAHTVRNQFMFRQFTYFKVLLTALTVGQVLLCFLSLIPSTSERVYASMRTFGHWLRGHGFMSVCAGSLILGFGIPLCGACPTTLFAQLGAFNSNTIYTAMGAFVGALLYGIFEAKFSRLKPKTHMKRQTIFGKLGCWYPLIALPFCGVCALYIYHIHNRAPWYRELHPEDRNRLHGVNTGMIQLKSWPPYAAGLVLGVVQVVLVFFMEDTLALSRGVQTLSAQWLRSPALQDRFPYLANFKEGIGRWWPVFFSVGIALGAHLSSQLSNTFLKTTGATKTMSLVGGLIMMFGARMAGGGTSRHLSGASMMFALSLVAIPCIILGGYTGAKVLQQTGNLNIYRKWGY